MSQYDSLIFALRERVSREDKEVACRSAADIIPTLETNRDQAIAELNKALETIGQLRGDLQQAQTARDEWKARAENAEAQFDAHDELLHQCLDERNQLKARALAAESRVKELSMQALADDAQHIENFEARKAAEARAEAAEARVKTREAEIDWHCEKLAEVETLNKELQAIVDTQFFGTRKAIEFAQRLDQAEFRAAMAEKELQEAHLELDRLGAPRDTGQEEPLRLVGRLQHFYVITAAARKACEAMRPFANAPSHGEYGGPLVQAKLFYECETDMRAGKFHSIDGANFAATRAARAGLAAAIGGKE